MHALSLTRPHAVRNAWVIWVVVFLAIAVIVAMPSNKRTVAPVYRTASINWCQGADLYEPGIGGYLYLPQAAVLFTPFSLPPFGVAEVLWRAFSIGILAFAVWRLAQVGAHGGGPALFPLMTLLVIPAALDSARNGQMNIPLAALMTLAAVDMSGRRWWPAAFWLCLGLALKPLIVILLGFSALLYREMRPRLAIGLLVLFAFPFLTQHPEYVLAQYKLFFLKSQTSGNPGSLARFSDLFGILGTVGINATFSVQMGIRIAAGVSALALCLLGLRRWGHLHGTLLFFGITASYTLLFNPRTENNTYIVAAVPMALYAAWALLRDRRRLIGCALVAAILVMSASYEITRGNNHWVCPAMCLFFLVYLIVILIRNEKPVPGQQ
ncbi:MAG: glycosyltransferase family 87 protein [Syntrophobacter sp.]